MNARSLADWKLVIENLLPPGGLGSLSRKALRIAHLAAGPA